MDQTLSLLEQRIAKERNEIGITVGALAHQLTFERLADAVPPAADWATTTIADTAIDVFDAVAGTLLRFAPAAVQTLPLRLTFRRRLELGLLIGAFVAGCFLGASRLSKKR